MPPRPAPAAQGGGQGPRGAGRRCSGLAAVALAALLAACGVPALAPDGPAPARAPLVYAPPGTHITLANSVNGRPSETRLIVAGASGPRGAYVAEDGRVGGVYPGCWDCGGAMRIEEEKYAGLWPLEPGRQVVFLRTAPDGQQARVLIRVAGRETVETPAGTFDAWLLDGRVENVTGPRHSAQVRAWWAPDPGWVVKAEGGDSLGNTLSSQAVAIVVP
jgi:hypothetical protein